MVRSRLAVCVLALAALIVALPLVVHGNSCGHDFDFHLLNWLEAARHFRHGDLHPQWADTPAWSAGEPRFVFYPPLSWTFGALLTLAASAVAHLGHLAPQTTFAATPALYITTVLFAAGIAFWRLARSFVGPTVALLVATLYLTNAYTLFTVYERSAFAELLASILLPVLFHLLLADRAPRVAPLALVVALLWLSNAPAAVMGCYTLALLALWRTAVLLRRPQARPAAWRFAVRITAATALGLALAGIYLVPAVAERPWVQLSMAVLPGLQPQDNTLFHHTADAAHDAVLHRASVLALSLLLATGLALVVALVRRNPPLPAFTEAVVPPSHPPPTAPFSLRQLALLLLTITALIALLLTPLAALVWRDLPELTFLQFPWRLLAVLAVIFALAIGIAFRGLRIAPRLLVPACLVLALCAALPAYRTFHQACDADDTAQARLAQFTSADSAIPGSDPTDEYTPASADNDSLADNNPPFRLLPLTAPNETSPPAESHRGAAPRTLDLDLRAPMLLVLNLRDYPAWLVLRNGSVLRDHIPRSDGLLTVELPAGRSHIDIRYRAPASERLGELTSALALCALLVVWRIERRIRT